MNEAKKSYNDHFYPSVSKNKQTAEDLYSVIYSFKHNTKLKIHDISILDRLLKQLNKPNNNLPRKVLKSIENNFERIRQSYQNVRN